MIEIIFVTYSCSSGILDDLGGVHLVKKDLVQLYYEVTVVDKSRLLWMPISVDQLLSLRLCQTHSKGANTGAEL